MEKKYFNKKITKHTVLSLSNWRGFPLSDITPGLFLEENFANTLSSSCWLWVGLSSGKSYPGWGLRKPRTSPSALALLGPWSHHVFKCPTPVACSSAMELPQFLQCCARLKTGRMSRSALSSEFRHAALQHLTSTRQAKDHKKEQ